jgi:iron complex outermembrane receptor protein
VKNNWSVYAQFAEGSIIPPSNVFDVTGGIVLTPPRPTVAKTYQTGTVMKFRRWTLDADYYYIHFQNGYDSYLDPATTEAVFVPTGPSNTQGFEAEGNVVIGRGFSAYANFSAGTAKYAKGQNYPNGGEWVASAPSNLETFTLFWQHKNWDIGFVDKRVGQMYNDNGSLIYNINGIKIPYPVDQAITIHPFNLANFFANYTIKNASWLRGSRIGLAINNLADDHSIVGIPTPAIAATATVPFVANPGDQLNLLPGRSVMVTFTAGWAPRR